MVCIYCGNPTKVINSRTQKRLNQKWRRRQCINCGAILTTIEQIEMTSALRVKSNKQYEPFLRDELFLSIYEAVRHRKRALEDAIGLTETVLSSLTPSGDASVDREHIVSEASKVLKRFDLVGAALYEALHPQGKI